MRVLAQLPWAKAARRHRKIKRKVRKLRGTPYLWAPTSGTDGNYPPPPRWKWPGEADHE